jgi:hypothetical protein
VIRAQVFEAIKDVLALYMAEHRVGAASDLTPQTIIGAGRYPVGSNGMISPSLAVAATSGRTWPTAPF